MGSIVSGQFQLLFKLAGIAKHLYLLIR